MKLVGILLMVIGALAGCVAGSGEDAASGDAFDNEDAAGNDTADDDSSDGAGADKAASICEEDSDHLDACADELYELYCRYEIPVILGQTRYTQAEALAACRDGDDPRWADIMECGNLLDAGGSWYEFGAFVRCMAGKGYRGENRNVFDSARGWITPDWSLPVQSVSALNFWYTESSDWFWTTQIGGAITDLKFPKLRIGYFWWGTFPPYNVFIVVTGDSRQVTDDIAWFYVEGTQYSGDPPPDWDEYSGRLELVPTRSPWQLN